MITFISDLDQTLIYSKRNVNIDNKQVKCVEYKDEEEITYMTNAAYQNFDKLLSSNDFVFIPCTLRNFNQTMRISFIQTHLPQFMICDNGGNIYINGIQDINYRKKIEKIIDISQLVKTKKEIETIISDGYVKYDNNTFLTCIFKTKEIAENQVPKIMNQIETPNLFSYDLQNRKFYIVPKNLDKSIAVQYLINHYYLKNIITSGDGKVDEKFTELGQEILLPIHSNFHHISEKRMNYEGILGGEEIIENLMNLTF